MNPKRQRGRIERGTWLSIVGLLLGVLLAVILGVLLYILNKDHRFD